MNAFLSPKRYFFAGNGWYIMMRPGDEVSQQHYINQRIKYNSKTKSTHAGPFLSVRSMERWFEAFLSLHSKNREEPLPYIADEVLIPDRN